MAEQVLPLHTINNHSNWLDTAKEKIKKGEHETASQRIDTLKELVVKSVNETLTELKLGKYQGDIRFFKVSSSEVMSQLANEWDVLVLNEWNGPIINDEDTMDKYLAECMKYADKHKYRVNHAFWEIILSEIWIYCKGIASEIFNNSCDIQLCSSLDKCLSVCTLLDILKAKDVLYRQTIAYNIHLQNAINKHIGTKLDIDKWSKTEDEKKIYKHCGLCIQKEAMKSGKAFVKLYKVHKIQKRKEKKRRAEQAKQKVKEKEIKTAQIKEEKKEIEKEEKKQETEERRDILFVLAIIIAVILVILVVLTQAFK